MDEKGCVGLRNGYVLYMYVPFIALSLIRQPQAALIDRDRHINFHSSCEVKNEGPLLPHSSSAQESHSYFRLCLSQQRVAMSHKIMNTRGNHTSARSAHPHFLYQRTTFIWRRERRTILSIHRRFILLHSIVDLNAFIVLRLLRMVSDSRVTTETQNVSVGDHFFSAIVLFLPSLVPTLFCLFLLFPSPITTPLPLSHSQVPHATAAIHPLIHPQDNHSHTHTRLLSHTQPLPL